MWRFGNEFPTDKNDKILVELFYSFEELIISTISEKNLRPAVENILKKLFGILRNLKFDKKDPVFLSVKFLLNDINEIEEVSS